MLMFNLYLYAHCNTMHILLTDIDYNIIVFLHEFFRIEYEIRSPYYSIFIAVKNNTTVLLCLCMFF